MQLTALDRLGASCLGNFANVSGVLSVQDTLIIIDIDAEIRGIVVAESDEVIEKNAAASLDLTVYTKAVFWLLSFGLIAVWVIYAVQPFFSLRLLSFLGGCGRCSGGWCYCSCLVGGVRFTGGYRFFSAVSFVW